MRGRHPSRARIASFFPFHSRREFVRVKRLCDQATRKAIRDRVLVRQGCERCRLKRNTEAHHDDYSQPLSVRWLCRFHHRQRDAELRIERGKQATPTQLLRSSFPAIQREAIAAHEAKGRLLGNAAAQQLIREATLALFDAMQTEGVSEPQLARQVHRSRQCVSGMFMAGVRTIAMLAFYADALGYEPAVVLKRRPQSGVTS